MELLYLHHQLCVWYFVRRGDYSEKIEGFVLRSSFLVVGHFIIVSYKWNIYSYSTCINRGLILYILKIFKTPAYL